MANGSESNVVEKCAAEDYIRKANDEYLNSISETGVLTVGSRLKRLADLLLSQVQEVYNQNDIRFKPVWFPFLLTLKHTNSLDIKSLAQRRKITHSAASQIIKEMTKEGLVTSITEEKDLRQKRVTITDKGISLLYQLVPHLKSFEAILLNLFGDELDNIFRTLTAVETELKLKPICERREEKLEGIEIIDFDDKYKVSFDRLNRAWLEKYFVVEDRDEQILQNPQKEILDKGGHIFFALYDNVPIGAVSLMKHDDDTIELAKMGVDEHFQGQGVGEKMVKNALDYAKNAGYKEMIIITDTKLKAALALYRKTGFEEDMVKKDRPYSHRGDIWFKKKL